MPNMPFLSRRAALVAGAGALLAPGLARAQGAAGCVPTGADILGPFFRPGAPFRASLAPAGAAGTWLRLGGRVLAPDCTTPLASVVLDVWQADHDGHYDNAEPGAADPAGGTRFRGRLRTDGEGRYELRTILPGRYRIPPGLPGFERFAGQVRPAHIHLTAAHPLLGPLTTQIYFEGDPHIAEDPWARQSRQVVALRDAGAEGAAAAFDIVLGRP
ncbi:dioxygenase family protein [Falsiroseomonas selenitidurans]|uniref:Twin-arginine translocation pathway signal protein n=1 Tax=Falsiroseomonas selenitidurans TaxID=2716335 RepID=A0ABX1EBX5_9PROT|nr:twin-arginine translocation pathway signal protein [Falsiroseomonas selenitidurans]NKC34320.1 twin-arginine translocation pathway signal protein [Falsiroseomonas selenitidurans]